MGIMNKIIGAVGKGAKWLKGRLPKAPSVAMNKGVQRAGGPVQAVKNFARDPAGSIFRSAAPERTFYTAKRMFTNPVNTLKHGWKGMRTFDKVLLAGNAAMSLPEIVSPQPGGPGRAEAIGRLLGGSTAWVGGSRLPFLGNIAMWLGGEGLGGAAGKAFGRTTGLGRAKKVPQMDGEQSVAAKLASEKRSESNEDLRQFTKRLIRQRQIELAEKSKHGTPGEIATVTTTDPVGTYERSA